MDEEQLATQQQPPSEVVEFFKLITEQLGRKDFASIYANNFKFEPSVWDLKILFGQLDQQKGPERPIDWQAAVTIPWFQVRMVAYFLRLNLAWYEHRHGALNIPMGMKPAAPEPPSGELADDPRAKEFYDITKRMYDEMFPS